MARGNMKKADERKEFDKAMGKIISISREELKRREEEWKRRRKGKKRSSEQAK